MTKQSRTFAGIVLVAAGLSVLALRMFPVQLPWLAADGNWPLIVLVVGTIFLGAAVLGMRDLVMPGVIVLGTGGILLYQSITGDWSSWSYLWALYPIFVGAGLVLAHALRGEPVEGFRRGARMLVLGSALFLIFWGIFRGFDSVEDFWPVLIIVAGVGMIIRGRTGVREQAKSP